MKEIVGLEMDGWIERLATMRATVVFPEPGAPVRMSTLPRASIVGKPRENRTSACAGVRNVSGQAGQRERREPRGPRAPRGRREMTADPEEGDASKTYMANCSTSDEVGDIIG